MAFMNKKKASQVFCNVFKDMLEEVRQDFTQSEVLKYKRLAESHLNDWKKTLQGEKPKPQDRRVDGSWKDSPPTLVTKPNSFVKNFGYDWMKHKQSNWIVDEEKYKYFAESSATNAMAYLRDKAALIAEKIIGDREFEYEVGACLDHQNNLDGYVVFYIDDDEFTLRCLIISEWDSRLESRPSYRFPIIVEDVVKDEYEYEMCGVRWMIDNF